MWTGGETPVKSTTPQHCSNPDNPVPDGQSGQNVAKTPPLSQKKPLSPVEEIQRAEEVDETASESSFENYESDFDPVDFFERILEGRQTLTTALSYFPYYCVWHVVSFHNVINCHQAFQLQIVFINNW